LPEDVVEAAFGMNPNKVKKEHFARALELAEMCQGETDRPHPKVGVVVVKDGEIISEAFRGQIGEGDHAEYIALERKSSGDTRIEGADLITTLEPCTQRNRDKRPCVSWIRSRRIRKVWIGTLDYNPVIRGGGESYLRNNGILIGRFPDDLQTKILEQNQKFFEYISSLQPSLSTEQLEGRVETIRNLVMTELLEMNKMEAVSDLLIDTRKLVVGAYERVLMMDEYDYERWNEIGWYLYNAQLLGPAGFAFHTCTKVNVSFFPGWVGLGAVEIDVYNKSPKGLELLVHPLNRAQQFLEKAYRLSSEPNILHRNAWIALFVAWKKLGNKKALATCAKRATSLDPDKNKEEKEK